MVSDLYGVFLVAQKGQEAGLATQGADLVGRNVSQMGFVCSREG